MSNYSVNILVVVPRNNFEDRLNEADEEPYYKENQDYASSENVINAGIVLVLHDVLHGEDIMEHQLLVHLHHQDNQQSQQYICLEYHMRGFQMKYYTRNKTVI